MHIIQFQNFNVCVYGLEVMLSSLTGICAFILVSALMSVPFLWIPYMAGSVPIQQSAGGFHAKNQFRCTTLFTLIYLLSLIICLGVPLDKYWLFITSAINLAIILRYSPVIMSSKPLQDKQKVINWKISILTGIINCLISAVAIIVVEQIKFALSMYFIGSIMAGIYIMVAVISNF